MRGAVTPLPNTSSWRGALLSRSSKRNNLRYLGTSSRSKTGENVSCCIETYFAEYMHYENMVLYRK
jgi:hypothetical protein